MIEKRVTRNRNHPWAGPVYVGLDENGRPRLVIKRFDLKKCSAKRDALATWGGFVAKAVVEAHA